MKLLELFELADKKEVAKLWTERSYERTVSVRPESGRRLPYYECGYKWYLSFLDDLKSLQPTKLRSEKYPNGELYVDAVRVYDEIEKEWFYDIRGKYALEEAFDFGKSWDTGMLGFDPWGEWLNFEFLDKGIKEYGVETVAVEIIWEMTWCGHTSKKQSKGLEKLSNRSKEPCSRYYGDGHLL